MMFCYESISIDYCVINIGVIKYNNNNLKY